MAKLTRQAVDQWRSDQDAVCERFQVERLESPHGLKVGVARNVRSGLVPLNGLRHPQQGDTTGWYLWAGEELVGGAFGRIPGAEISGRSSRSRSSAWLSAPGSRSAALVTI